MVFKRTPWQNFIRVADHELSQLKLMRMLFGGDWVRMDGTWKQVDVIRVCDDGTRVFRQELAGCGVSFHETHVDVQAIESWS
jgi:hypothetical protein